MTEALHGNLSCLQSSCSLEVFWVLFLCGQMANLNQYGSWDIGYEINNGNKTEWSPIRSVIIRVITKSDDRAVGVRFVYLKPHLTQVGNLKKGKKQSLDLVTKWANSKTAYQENFNYLCNVNLILWYSQSLSNGWVDLLYSMMKMSSIQSADSSKASVS